MHPSRRRTTAFFSRSVCYVGLGYQRVADTIGSMSPWVLPERTLGTVRYTETYPGKAQVTLSRFSLGLRITTDPRSVMKRGQSLEKSVMILHDPWRPARGGPAMATNVLNCSKLPWPSVARPRNGQTVVQP